LEERVKRGHAWLTFSKSFFVGCSRLFMRLEGFTYQHDSRHYKLLDLHVPMLVYLLAVIVSLHPSVRPFIRMSPLSHSLSALYSVYSVYCVYSR